MRNLFVYRNKCLVVLSAFILSSFAEGMAEQPSKVGRDELKYFVGQWEMELSYTINFSNLFDRDPDDLIASIVDDGLGKQNAQVDVKCAYILNNSWIYLKNLRLEKT